SPFPPKLASSLRRKALPHQGGGGVASPSSPLGEEKRRLLADALAEGFDIVRIASPDGVPETAERLRRFLADGHHGEMAWLATTTERRGEPRRLWAEAGAVVMLGLNYGPAQDPLVSLAAKDRAT